MSVPESQNIQKNLENKLDTDTRISDTGLNMSLTIRNPRDQKQYVVRWLDIETFTGNLVILPGHEPAYFVIKPQSTARWALKNGDTDSMFVVRGVIIVDRRSVILITDTESSVEK